MNEKISQNLDKYFNGWETMDPKKIKEQFKKLAVQFHPDKNNGNDTEFKEMKACYDILINPQELAKLIASNTGTRFTTKRHTDDDGGFTNFAGSPNATAQAPKHRRAQPTPPMSEKTKAELTKKLDKEYQEFLKKMWTENPEESRVDPWKRDILLHRNDKKSPLNANPQNTTSGDTQEKFFPDINKPIERKRRVPINHDFSNQEKNYQNVKSTLEQIQDRLNENPEKTTKIILLKKLNDLQKEILTIQSQYTFANEQDSNLQQWQENISELISKINREVQTNNSNPTPPKKPPTNESENLAAKLLEEELLNLFFKNNYDTSHQKPATNQPTKADRRFAGLDDFNKINRIMKTKGIEINNETKTVLTEEQIKNIKEIFKQYPTLQKLPRNTLINKKIKEIKLLLDLYKDHAQVLSTSYEKKQNLENMLAHYTDLNAIMNKFNLNLPFSINKKQDSKNNQEELYIVYPLQLGTGAFGRVKLAQDLNTGKVLAAKIQHTSKSTPMDVIKSEEIVLKALDRYWGQTSRKEFSIKTQQKNGSKKLVHPTLIVKNIMFSEFAEGITLGKYLLQEKDQQQTDDLQLKMLNALLTAFKEVKLLSEGERKFVHLDLHFNNIQYFPTTSVAKTLDFGYSAEISNTTQTADITNTYLKKIINNLLKNSSADNVKMLFKKNHPHCPPEIITNNFIDSSADIYAFGAQLKQYSFCFVEPLKSKLLQISVKMAKETPRERIDFNQVIREFEALIKDIKDRPSANQNHNNRL